MVKRFLPVFIIIFILALAFLLHYIFYSSSHESTDDAFISGTIVQVSPRVSGQVTNVYVQDNQRVKKGDLLLEIDPRDYDARLRQARASLSGSKVNAKMTTVTMPAEKEQQYYAVRAAEAGVLAAQAQVDLTEKNLARYQDLLKKDEVSKQQVDQAEADEVKAKADLNSAMAQVDVASNQFKKADVVQDQIRMSESQRRLAAAQVKEAALNLSYTKIYASEDGRVTSKTVFPGNFVQPGEALLALVTRDLWVIANLKETQLKRIKIGQPVDIHVDATGKTIKGHIDSIQSGTGAVFSLLPPENATGNYVKVVQRVPVKIIFDDPNESSMLAPGMSVVPVITTK